MIIGSGVPVYFLFIWNKKRPQCLKTTIRWKNFTFLLKNRRFRKNNYSHQHKILFYNLNQLAIQWFNVLIFPFSPVFFFLTIHKLLRNMYFFLLYIFYCSLIIFQYCSFSFFPFQINHFVQWQQCTSLQFVILFLYFNVQFFQQKKTLKKVNND